VIYQAHQPASIATQIATQRRATAWQGAAAGARLTIWKLQRENPDWDREFRSATSHRITMATISAA